MNPYQPAREEESERGSEETTAKSKVELAGVAQTDLRRFLPCLTRCKKKRYHFLKSC